MFDAIIISPKLPILSNQLQFRTFSLIMAARLPAVTALLSLYTVDLQRSHRLLDTSH